MQAASANNSPSLRYVHLHRCRRRRRRFHKSTTQTRVPPQWSFSLYTCQKCAIKLCSTTVRFHSAILLGVVNCYSEFRQRKRHTQTLCSSATHNKRTTCYIHFKPKDANLLIVDCYLHICLVYAADNTQSFNGLLQQSSTYREICSHRRCCCWPTTARRRLHWTRSYCQRLDCRSVDGLCRQRNPQLLFTYGGTYDYQQTVALSVFVLIFTFSCSLSSASHQLHHHNAIIAAGRIRCVQDSCVARQRDQQNATGRRENARWPAQWDGQRPAKWWWGRLWFLPKMESDRSVATQVQQQVYECHLGSLQSLLAAQHQEQWRRPHNQLCCPVTAAVVAATVNSNIIVNNYSMMSQSCICASWKSLREVSLDAMLSTHYFRGHLAEKEMLTLQARTVVLTGGNWMAALLSAYH